MRRYGANLITLFGIIFSVWVNVVLWKNSLPIQTLTLVLLFGLMIAGITDLMDGHFARVLGSVTKMGVSLDRLRDKILVMPFFVFLVVKFWNEEETFRVAMLCVLLLVEIFLVITGVYGLVKGLDVSAHKAGKIKMNLYFFLLFVWVFSIEPRLYEYSKHFNFLFTVSLFPTVYFAFGSLSGYVERFFPSSQK